MVPGIARAGTLDQQQASVPNFLTVNAGAFAAQTFAAGLTGNLDQVDLYLSGGSSQPLTVQIRAASAGLPTFAVLATASVPPVAGPAQWFSIGIGPTPVVAGTQYAIVLSSPDTYQAYGDPAGTYAGGQALDSFSPGVYNPVGGDLAFRTYVAVASAVTFRSINVSREANGVLIRWRTASELDVLGFNVYRAVNGRRVRVNQRLIRAHGHGSYSFLDRRAPRARVAGYWIQAVDVDGSRSWYGPAKAARTRS